MNFHPLLMKWIIAAQSHIGIAWAFFSLAQYFYKRSRSRFRLKNFEPEPGSFLTGWSCQGSLFFGIIANSLVSCMRFRDWILIMYVFIMYIMCFIIFEEKPEIQDQYPLSLNRDWDRLQKYWANVYKKGLILNYSANNILYYINLILRLRKNSLKYHVHHCFHSLSLIILWDQLWSLILLRESLSHKKTGVGWRFRFSD